MDIRILKLLKYVAKTTQDAVVFDEALHLVSEFEKTECLCEPCRDKREEENTNKKES